MEFLFEKLCQVSQSRGEVPGPQSLSRGRYLQETATEVTLGRVHYGHWALGQTMPLTPVPPSPGFKPSGPMLKVCVFKKNVDALLPVSTGDSKSKGADSARAPVIGQHCSRKSA